MSSKQATETTSAAPQIKRIKKPAASKPRTEAQIKAYEKMAAKRKELIEQRKKLKEEPEAAVIQSQQNHDPEPSSSDSEDDSPYEYEYASQTEEEKPKKTTKKSSKRRERAPFITQGDRGIKSPTKQALLKLLLESDSSDTDEPPEEEIYYNHQEPIKQTTSIFSNEYNQHIHYEPIVKQPVRTTSTFANRFNRIQGQQTVAVKPTVSIFQ